MRAKQESLFIASLKKVSEDLRLLVDALESNRKEREARVRQIAKLVIKRRKKP